MISHPATKQLAREAEIASLGRQVELLVEGAATFGTPGLLDDAHAICAECAAKIASREPEFVRALEAARGML